MMGAAAAGRPEEPLELHWDEVCALSTTEPATLACYEPKRRDLNLKPRRGHRLGWHLPEGLLTPIVARGQ